MMIFFRVDLLMVQWQTVSCQWKKNVNISINWNGKLFAYRMFNFQVEQFAHHHNPEGKSKLFFTYYNCCCCCGCGCHWRYRLLLLLILLLLPFPIRCLSTLKFTLLLYCSVKIVARADMHARVFIRTRGRTHIHNTHSSKRLFHEQDNIHKMVYIEFSSL